MQKITVVIRVDAGAVIITPEIVESALNTYLAENGNVTVFHAAQQSVQPTSGRLANFQTKLVVPLAANANRSAASLPVERKVKHGKCQS